MKKLVTLFLILTMIVSVFAVMPVSAATVEKDVAKGKIATGWYNGGANTFGDSDFISGYDPSKMTDGNDATYTFAKVEGKSGHMLVIDLGKEYDISKIRIKTVSTDTAKALESANSMTETNVNSSACLFAADKVPENSDFNGVNVAAGVTDVVRINTDYQTLDNIDKTYVKIGKTTPGAAGDEIGTHRYVGVYAPYSAGFAVSSLEIYSKVEVTSGGGTGGDSSVSKPTVTKNIDVAKGKLATGWYNGGVSTFGNSDFISGYDPSKMTDGNDETYTLAKVNNQSGHMLVIDLGKAYDISKIRIKTVSTDTAKALESANSMAETNVNSSACLFVADKVPENSDFNGANIADGVTNVVRVNTDYQTLDNIDKTYVKIGKTTPGAAGDEIGTHRYVGVYAPYSAGFAVSSLEVWADAEVEAEEALLSSKKAVFSSGDSIGNDRANAEANVVDGSTDTSFAAVAYSEDYCDDGTQDARVNFVSDFDIVLDLGAKSAISKIAFTPFNPDKNSGDVVYTIGGTNDYAANAGMKNPDVTTLAEYTGPADKVTLTKADLSGEYRFIVINVKNSGEKSSVIAGVREIEVYGYTADDDAVKADTSMRRVSRGITPIASNQYRWEGNDGNITDGKYSLGYASVDAVSGTRNCIILDLGAEYTISAVDLMQIKGNSGFTDARGFEIIASNTEITEENISTATYDVLASGLYFKDNTVLKLMYIPVSSETKYRYVGVKGCSGSYMPFREFDVYTSDASVVPTIGTMTYSADETDLKFEIYADNIKVEAEYKVFVASYDQNGVLINLNTENTLSFAEGENKLSGKFEDAVSANAKSVKVYVFDGTTSLKPITVCVGK